MNQLQIKFQKEFYKSLHGEGWGFIPKRLHDIIVMCQNARERYSLAYIEKYGKQIRKFSKEIEDEK